MSMFVVIFTLPIDTNDHTGKGNDGDRYQQGNDRSQDSTFNSCDLSKSVVKVVEIPACVSLAGCVIVIDGRRATMPMPMPMPSCRNGRLRRNVSEMNDARRRHGSCRAVDLSNATLDLCLSSRKQRGKKDGAAPAGKDSSPPPSELASAGLSSSTQEIHSQSSTSPIHSLPSTSNVTANPHGLLYLQGEYAVFTRSFAECNIHDLIRQPLGVDKNEWIANNSSYSRSTRRQPARFSCRSST
jgi:hypothetical protein